MVTREECSYAAGIFDGEGTVYISPSAGRLRQHMLMVAVANNNREVLEWLKERWGGSIQLAWSGRTFRWCVPAQLARVFLEDVAPYVIVKREHIPTALALQATMGKPEGVSLSEAVLEQREGLRQQLRALNHA